MAAAEEPAPWPAAPRSSLLLPRSLMCGLDCRPLPVLALALLLRGQQSEASVFPEDCLNMEGGKIQATYLGQALACPTCQAPFFKGCLSAAPIPSVSLRPGPVLWKPLCLCLPGVKGHTLHQPPHFPVPRFHSPMLYPPPPPGGTCSGAGHGLLPIWWAKGPQEGGSVMLCVLGLWDSQEQHRKMQSGQMLRVVSSKLKCILPSPPSSIHMQHPPTCPLLSRSRVFL